MKKIFALFIVLASVLGTEAIAQPNVPIGNGKTAVVLPPGSAIDVKDKNDPVFAAPKKEAPKQVADKPKKKKKKKEKK